MQRYVNTVTSPVAGGAEQAKWDPDKHPFVFEIGGEVSPEFTDSPASATPKAYEYTWTLSHPGAKRSTSGGHFWNSDSKSDRPLWTNLDDSPAARIYLYFPTTTGWRIQEVPQR